MPGAKTHKKGYLVLIGGAEDRRNDKVVLRKLINLNDAKNIIVVTSATLYPAETAEDYFYAFRDLGIKNIQILDIRDSRETNNPGDLEKINQADVVFFTGGDQVRLTRILLNTPLLKRIKERFLKEGLTIAGTSAGASAAANPMTFDGDNQGLIKGTVKFDEGFGFLENITIDTHFVARGRLGRLTQFLCNGYTQKGIGIGENTSISIKPDNTFEVAGTGIVTVVSTKEVCFSNFDKIEEGERISIDGIKIGFLQDGSVFDMNSWEIKSCQQTTDESAQFEKAD
ncbi:MAG: cyanophycinase [Bacteroidales bacterium]|nr:cyanophycinase [Bacteroidales bacterium]